MTIFAWTNIQTTGLPENGLDFTNVHILEMATIFSDTDLEPEVGYFETLQCTREAYKTLKKDTQLFEYHRLSGLLKSSVRSRLHLDDAEDLFLNYFDEYLADKRESKVVMAGSGVASFHLPLLRAKMPRLAQKFEFYTLDIGHLRRAIRLLGNIQLDENHPRNHRRVGETGRAGFDAEWALENAKVYQNFLYNASEEIEDE